MLEGLKAFVEGRIKRDSSIRAVDLTIRKIAAIEALSRFNKASPKLLDSISILPNAWPTSTLIDWINLLQRLHSITDREKRMREAEDIIRSRLDLRGTKLNFSTENRDNLWWLMTSIDVNALRTIITFLHSEKWKEYIPKIVNGVIARQRQGHWDTTTANAWGMIAMKKF